MFKYPTGYFLTSLLLIQTIYFVSFFYHNEVKQKCSCNTLKNLSQWCYVCLVFNYSINSVAFKKFAYIMYVKLKHIIFIFEKILLIIYLAST